MDGPMRVLHVDDEEAFLELTKTSLQRIDDRYEIETTTDVDDAMEILDRSAIDCIVSDYDMPTQDGIAFLNRVRREHGPVPFLLFTGKGSEDVASEAISNGVTGYLQKQSGIQQFELLANRLERAITANRTERDLSEQIRQLETLVSNLPGIMYRSRAEPGWPVESIRGDCRELFGYTPEELEHGSITFGDDLIHPDDREKVTETIEAGIDDDGTFEIRYRILTRDGETKWVWERGRQVDTIEGDIAILEGFITDVTSDHYQRERQRVLFEDAADAITEVVFTDDVAIIDRVNPAFEEIFGVDAAETEGAAVNEVIVPPEDQIFAAEIDRQVKEGEIVEEELIRQTAEGLRWFLLRTVPFTLGNEHRAYATYVDITEQKDREDSIEALHSAAQEMLRQSDETSICQSTVSAAADVLGLSSSGIFLYDASTNRLEPVAITDTIDIETTDLPAFTPEDELVWRTFMLGNATIIDGDDHQFQCMAAPGDLAQSGLIIPIGEWGVLISTSQQPAEFGDADVRLAGLLASAAGSALDANLRENQLESLHRAATEIDAATSPEAIYDRLITAAEEILEFDFAVADAAVDDELVTMATSSAIDDDSFFERTSIESTESVAAASYRQSMPDITEDIRDHDIDPADSAFRSAMTVPIEGHGIFQAAAKRAGAFDEDDLELAELLVAHAREALTRLERTRELTDRTIELNRQNDRLEKFAEIVSHDLRNPLNVISGRLELARNDPSAENFQPIAEAVDRMESIIDHTLTLAREGRSVGETESIDLEEIATSCWARVSTGDAAMTVLDSHRFSGDPERVKQIIENLFRNTIEHGEEPIEVRVGPMDRGFYIADNGPGIPPADREKVLQPGYTTGDDGVGIGLAIVAEIANAHGWDIAITESWSGGTRFEFTDVDTSE